MRVAVSKGSGRPAGWINAKSGEDVGMVFSAVVRESQCVEGLAERVPVVVGAHQPLVADRNLLPPETHLEALLRVAEFDVALTKIERVSRARKIRAGVKAECSGVVAFQDKLQPGERLHGGSDSQAIQVDAIISVPVRIEFKVGASDDLRSEPDPRRQSVDLVNAILGVGCFRRF